MIKVKNLVNSINGRSVANQFVIEDTDNNITVFQSYQSPIVKIDWGQQTITVYRDWDYSQTTGKYRNMFMNQYGFDGLASKSNLERCLNEGIYNNRNCPFAIVADYT